MKSKILVDALKKHRDSVILMLAKNEGFTVSEIAVIMNLSKQLVSHIIKKSNRK